MSSVWLIVPRFGRATTTAGQPEPAGEVEDGVLGVQRHHDPADAFDDQHVAARLDAFAAIARPPPSPTGCPARSAATAGASGSA